MKHKNYYSIYFLVSEGTQLRGSYFKSITYTELFLFIPDALSPHTTQRSKTLFGPWSGEFSVKSF